MDKWVTSDLHFGHANILNFEKEARARFTNGISLPPTATVEDWKTKGVQHMDEMMIEEWNAVVGDYDEVYILGDVSFHNPAKTAEILRKLNGILFLIPGNHDKKLLEHEIFRQCFYAIHPPIYSMVHGKHNIEMCHFPIAEWHRCHRGALHFYGHLHSNKIGGEYDTLRNLNVGMDPRGKIVTHMDEACALAYAGQVKGHHE